MIPGLIIKGLLSKVLEHLFKKSKRFKKVLDYVNEENDADKRISALETEQAITKGKTEYAILEIDSLKQELKRYRKVKSL